MGLAQSKRSVNITTDPAKEGVVAEGTGKLEKIGEVDQLKAQANGDTQHNDGENDSTTEKSNKEGGDGGGGGDTSVAAASPTSDGESDGNNKTLENGSNDESLNDSKAPAADEANKKAKKPKKKWSFRSLSFSKKDKQKPAKKEKDEERVNGECEKVPEEPGEIEISQKKRGALSLNASKFMMITQRI
uniref:Uncharacterized protein n=1 Tax=Anopheles stephensi TaxID=30069 RepID=A0A182YFV8_ANOST